VPLLSRIAIIFLAFVIASTAAGITIAVAVLGPDWPALSGDLGLRTGFWVLVFFASSLSAAVTIIPLFLTAVVAEAFRLRSILLYGLIGFVVMPAGYFWFGFSDRLEPSAAQLPIGHEVAIAAASGVVFGVVYWLLAGRKAGNWRNRRT